MRIIWCHSHIARNYLPEWHQHSETLALDMHLPLLLTKNGKLHKEQHSGAGTKSASWYSPNLAHCTPRLNCFSDAIMIKFTDCKSSYSDHRIKSRKYFILLQFNAEVTNSIIICPLLSHMVSVVEKQQASCLNREGLTVSLRKVLQSLLSCVGLWLRTGLETTGPKQPWGELWELHL